MAVAQNDRAVTLTKPKIRRSQFSFFSVKPTGKTTNLISRFTEVAERRYLLSNKELLWLQLGQGVNEFWAAAGPVSSSGYFCILFTHDCVLSFTYQKRTPFYSPLIFLKYH